MPDDHCADGSEEPRKAEIGNYDHHAKEQEDGFIVDGTEGFFHRKDIEPDHQARADDRCTGAVHSKARQAADCEHDVGTEEDKERNHSVWKDGPGPNADPSNTAAA